MLSSTPSSSDIEMPPAPPESISSLRSSAPGQSYSTYAGANPAEVYRHQLDDLLNHGEAVEVRGRQTLELLNVVTHITNPLARCALTPGRRWNPWLALSEALWVLAGHDDVAALAPYNKHIVDYSDDGLYLYGAYGPRIADQIAPLLGRLRADSADRRGVLQIWTAQDLTADVKDPPCNTELLFKLRGGVLHMTVVCRSNDLHWGLHAVNLPVFSILQEYLAARLGVGLGTQTHLSQSLHIYTDEPRAQAITARMLEQRHLPVVMPEPSRLFADAHFPLIDRHDDFARACSDVLDGTFDGSWCGLRFAQDFLATYHTKNFSQSKMYDAGQHPDWIAAAGEFVK